MAIPNGCCSGPPNVQGTRPFRSAETIGEGGNDFLGAAVRIGHGLLEQSITSADGWPSWTGDDLHGSDIVTARVVRAETGSGLYGGTAGIGWFLAHLGKAVDDAELRGCGVRALQGAIERSHVAIDADGLSLYNGAAGVALSAWQAGVRLTDVQLQARAVDLAEGVARAVIATHVMDELDLIGGIAGIAVALAALHRAGVVPTAIPACRKIGRSLLHHATTNGVFVSWPQSLASVETPHLCGLAHGASGIAWALFEIARICGDEQCAGVARQALAYERSWYTVQNGWADLRRNTLADSSGKSVESPGMTAWCHGSIGIAALRLHLQVDQPDPGLLADAAAGIHATRAVVMAAQRGLETGCPFDATLCHGLAGAVELYTLAHQLTGMADHARAARRSGHVMLRLLQLTQGRWTCGLTGATQIPGLMVGEAGIGTTFLRLHDQTAIDSPLLAGCR